MKTFDFDKMIDRRGTNSEKWDGLEKRFGANDLVSMWVADMDFEAPPCVKETIKSRAEHGIFGYTEQNDKYYDSITRWVARRHGWNIQNKWICNTPGVVPALSMALMAFTQPGDSVIIQPPVYYPFFSVIGGRGRKIVENPLIFNRGKFHMDLDDLRSKIDSDVKALFLCSPHNPVGRVWTRDELEKLSEICIENEILVISDEIHSDIVFEGNRHIPLASISEEIAERTITCISPSKTFNIAGLSTSAAIIPDKKTRENFKKVLDFLHLGEGNLFGTFALEAAYNGGEPWLNELLLYLQGNLEYLDNFCKERLPGVSLIYPEGTYVPFLDFRTLELSGEELQDLLIRKAKVALDGGYWFGTGGEGFARINIATPRMILKEGLENIASGLRENFKF